jgi:hypothetical protein
MACNKKITADILFDCADAPLKGLDGGKAVILNYDDVDFVSSVQAGATITDLVALAVGFDVSWYKELASTAVTFAANAEDVDGFSHSFAARLSVSNALNAERANELKNGRFIVVVKTAYKGAANAEAFKIYGWDSGLELTQLDGNSNENGGSLLFTLGTREGTVEKYPYNILIETNFATTETAFDAKFSPI